MKGTKMAHSTNSTTETLSTLSTLDTLAQTAPAHVRARYEAQRDQSVVNPIVLAQLLSVGSEKPVKPQMIYNYLRKGKFTQNPEAIGQNSTQKKVIDLGEANAFAQGYVSRRVARESEQAAKIAAELA